MKEQEYFSCIAKARTYTACGRMDAAEALLEELYEYKPVRLLWFVAKAEYMLKKTGDLNALDLLHEKYYLAKECADLTECMEFRIKALQEHGAVLDAVREEYCWRKSLGEDRSALESELEQALEAYAEDTKDTDALAALYEAFYKTGDIHASLLVQEALLRLHQPIDRRWNVWREKKPNYGYLEEKLTSNCSNTFILVMDEYLSRSLEVLGTILSSFGHQIFLLMPPIPIEVQEPLDLRETISVSLENMECYPDLCAIPPIQLEGKGKGDNRGYLIDHLCREKSAGGHAILLCSGYLLENLFLRQELQGRSGLLSDFLFDFEQEKLQFGWVGSYMSYISDIYCSDVQPSVSIKPDVEFSILIPVRNAAFTLQHTLKTCLDQRWQGSYEIVVNDNSVDGDDGVYRLCQQLNDSRIRYVRTPRQLQLPKSFEFGCLQTRGEFILPLGADDGLLPWTLETLKQVRDRYPDEDIIQWERGFYAWPGFNGGQENMFQIPRKYVKNRVQIQYRNTDKILDGIAEDVGMIYAMPLLYINSGFRRRYLHRLLEKTGKLWNGGNQDLQMGIVNCCINRQIPFIIYPLAIAGMSSSSLGYLWGVVGDTGQEEFSRLRSRQWCQDNIGLYISTSRAKQAPPIGVDAASLYMVLSQSVMDGLLDEDRADEILSWRTAALQISQALTPIDARYDWFVQRVRHSAASRGAEDLQWFDKTIYPTVTDLRRFSKTTLEQARKRKTYQEGTDPLGGETLDASRYGVHNIAEAVELFAKRTGL